jgi:hypothetical protein
MSKGLIHVGGEYYKNTKEGKKAEPYSLVLHESTEELGILRKAAHKILLEQDKEYQGIRTLYIVKEDEKVESESQIFEKTRFEVIEEEIRTYAKELKITNWHNKRLASLIREIELKQDL